jgi:hypothetical protein
MRFSFRTKKIDILLLRGGLMRISRFVYSEHVNNFYYFLVLNEAKTNTFMFTLLTT